MRLVLLAPAIALLLAGCRGEPAARPDPPPRRDLNVVVLLVDTLRADHLGAYGYDRPTSPNLDAFAASAVLFENARAQSACTFPSANSILTSRYPALFLGQPEGRIGIPPGVESLAEILDARGYDTLAISASPIVRRSPSQFNPHGGFERGFDAFEERCEWRDARCLVRQLRARLPTLGRPFFLYLHFMDPHDPYRPPRVYRRRFAGDGAGVPDFIRAGDPRPIDKHRRRARGPVPEVPPADLAHLVDLYDDEIAFFDQRFPLVLALLDEAGAGGDTLVALISDHGEDFLEHGQVKHCNAPYDTQVRVPMILKLPGGPAGVRVAAPVASIDLVPTLLDYLGEELAAHAFDGRSLRPLVEGRPAGAEGEATAEQGRDVYSAQFVWRAVTDGRFKLLYRLHNPPSFALFDLESDPGEQRDLHERHPDELQRLRRSLFEWTRRTEGGLEEGLRAAEETERRLRAVGYLD